MHIVEEYGGTDLICLGIIRLISGKVCTVGGRTGEEIGTVGNGVLTGTV